MKTWLLAVVVAACVALAAAQDLKPLLEICASAPAEQTKSLSDKIALPELYKISGSVTDWTKASTSLIVESATKDFRVLQRQTRDLQPERWFRNLTDSSTAHEYMFVNLTSGMCDTTTTRPELFKVARFSSIFGVDTSSFNSIIQGLIEFDKTHKGFLVADHIDVVGGVNAMKWVACVDGANATDTKVLLEVRYAGEDTIPPASSPFSNPLILSIRIAELPSFNSTVALNHVSVELDRYELPSQSEMSIEHGIVCKNRNSSLLQLKSLDEYAAILDYYDYATNRSEVVEVLFSKSRQVFIVAGDSFENGVRIFKSTPARYRNGTDYILHDFKYGYEFTMSRDACESFSTLEDSTADVFIGQNKTLSMMPMEHILVDGSLRWNEYPSDVDMVGLGHRTFRASDVHEEKVVEVHVTGDGEVESMSWFHEGTRHLALTLTITRVPIESSRLNLRAAQLSDCYEDNDTKFANNTWIVAIRDKSLVDVAQVGLNRLNAAVVESIATSVYPVIPYRVVVFWVENRDGGLSLIVRIAEKTAKPPALVVTGYNLTAELATLELIGRVNETMLAEKMPINVEKVDGVKEEWMADAKTMKQYPPESDTGFVGYTGGAMFVLAIFCLLIGVSIGSVGVFVATRRHRISTLAYQVFE